MDRSRLTRTVEQALRDQPVTDLHTHCYAPAFGASPQPRGLLLWGIDELVTYNYLVAEVFRAAPASGPAYDRFWSMPRTRQADHIWKTLFVDRTPVSEACRGVLTTLERLGLDPNEKSLEPYRKWCARQSPDQYVDKVMQLANVDSITMTNEVFSDHERTLWLEDPDRLRDSRFQPALRIDPLLNETSAALECLNSWGYDTDPQVSQKTIDEVKRFLTDWINRMKPIYLATSLPPSFRYPDAAHQTRDRIINRVLLPVLGEHGLAWAMMIGARRGINPSLHDAGDTGGHADVSAVTHLCATYPGSKFLVTMLARDNQHELCVAARKFGNLMLFGCWWFLNNPSLIEEITRMQLELLGMSFIPQHSDARILDQLIYKWDHTRTVLAKVLTDKYTDLGATGYDITDKLIHRDIAWLLRDQFRSFIQR